MKKFYSVPEKKIINKETSDEVESFIEFYNKNIDFLNILNNSFNSIEEDIDEEEIKKLIEKIKIIH